MAKRIYTRIGDIFCTRVSDKWKVYFQYICNDLTQLNSSVIRVFKTRYPLNEEVDMEEVVKGEIHFYAHTILRLGINLGYWEKVGKSKSLGLEGLDKIWFATSHETRYIEDPPETVFVDPDQNWTIWKVNEEWICLSMIPKELYPYLEGGSVLPYMCINDRIRLGYMTGNDLIYKYQKRIPLPDVDSYTMVEEDGVRIWRHYLGEYVVQEVIENDGVCIRLSKEEPDVDGWHLDEREFWQTNWKYYNFITKEEFDKVWDMDKL